MVAHTSYWKRMTAPLPKSSSLFNGAENLLMAKRPHQDHPLNLILMAPRRRQGINIPTTDGAHDEEEQLSPKFHKTQRAAPGNFSTN